MSFKRNVKVVERCLLMTTDPGDLVLDPTCGSGTTAYVAEQWGRRWITCDTSRVALALARTRLMAAKFPYYYLADDYPQIGPTTTDDEIKKVLRTKYSAPSTETRYPTPVTSSPDIRKGFVYKRVPHVTLKSIANNPDIKEGMTAERDRRRHRPPCRHRNALRPTVPGQQARPRQRPVHRRKPQPPPHDQRRGKAAAGRGRQERAQDADHRPRRLRHDDHRQPPQSRRAEYDQKRTVEVR